MSLDTVTRSGQRHPAARPSPDRCRADSRPTTDERVAVSR